MVVGLHPDHMAHFYETYGVFAPNYHFSPKYKLGSWDGKIRFFHKTGKTYVNLLDSLLPQIVDLEYDVRLTDLRKSRAVYPESIDAKFFSIVSDPITSEPWTMRPYQIDMVNTLLEKGSGVGIAGTGAGKTSICAAIALCYERTANFRSIIIVPDKNLTTQTHREYEFFGVDVGEYSGERKHLDHKHIVSTWQALKNNPTILDSFQVIIVDECHGVRGNVLTKLLVEHAKDVPHRFGVTGTLPKPESDILAVQVAVGTVQYTIPAHELIDQGYLAKIHIDIMQIDADLKNEYHDYLDHPIPGEDVKTYKQFKDDYFGDWPSEKRYMQTEPERLQWIADYIDVRRKIGKGNVLCLVNGIRFGKKLASMIDDAKFVYGQDEMKTRKEIYGLFHDNDNLAVLATVNIASTGLDIPRIFNLIYIDVGKSFIRTVQSLGRGLRKAADKEHVNVTDICSDLKYSKRHLSERVRFYKEAQYPYKKRVVDII